MGDLHVIQVICGKRSRAKVDARLSDGRLVKAPAGLVSWGGVLAESDIVEVESNGKKTYSHKDLVKKAKKKPYMLYRDFSEYDANKEKELIRTCILKCKDRVLGGFWASDHLDDLVMDCFYISFYRDWYRRWDPAQSNYEAYIQSAVANRLTDIRRKASNQFDRKVKSLNDVIGEDGTERIDFIVDATNQDVVESVCEKALYDAMNAVVVHLDSAGESGKEGTGLPGFTYKGIFDALVDGASAGLDSYLKTFKYPRNLMERYVDELRDELKAVASGF